MEPNKESKIIDYKVDQYGDYPFMNSTLQSGRKWISISKVN